MSPTFSLVICTRNRRVQLCGVLDGFAEQVASGRCPWEVLVIDNGSSDGTQASVEQRASGYPVPLRLVSEERLGIAMARTRGLREAESSVVVYVDDDIGFGVDWVAAVEEAFEDPQVDAAGGPIHTVYPLTADPALVAALEADGGSVTGQYLPGGGRRCLTDDGRASLPHGANMAVRIDVARAVGEFEPRFGWGSEMLPGEETDFLRRVAAAGYRIWYLPAMAVDHFIQPEKIDWAHIRRWHLGYGRASVRMRRRPSLLGLTLKVLEQSARWTRYRLQTVFDRERRSCRPYRKLWQAEGRLRELCGIRDRPA